MKDTYVAIMAGGIGSRFWPASRTDRPKQFLDIMGVGKSLIRLTFERFTKIAPKENIYIVTNEIYKDLVLEHLPEINEQQVICEPSRNNTAPCVAYTALKLRKLNPKANFIVAPSDHIILNEGAFIEYLEKALNFTKLNDALVTLGIQPNRPDTGYGYINFHKDPAAQIKKVIKFTEKPQLETAKKFVASGDYLWNAGIFIWTAEAIVSSFRKNAPEILEILEKGEQEYNTSSEQSFINQAYPTTPKVSIDYAIMEKADNVFTIPSEFGWSDLGTWGSLYAESDKDDSGNVLKGDQFLIDDVKNCLVRTPKDKLVVLKGLEDFIIVDEEDVLLIFPKSKEQEIKQITTLVKDKFDNKFA